MTRSSAKKKQPKPRPKAKAKVQKAPAKKPTKKPASKSVIDRIRDVVVAPKATLNDIPLITPLPKVAEISDFGSVAFEKQANLVFNTFPAHEAEIIGKTGNSGAGTVEAPKSQGR